MSVPNPSTLLFCCPVCLGREHTPATADGTFRRCVDCSLVQQTFPPDDLATRYSRDEYDEARRSYGLGIGAWARFHHDYAVMMCRLDQLQGVLAGPGSSWLDYGCGNGASVAALRRTGYLAYGVEADSAFAAEASELTGHSVFPVRRLNDSRLTADVMSLFDVLEHVLDPVGLLDHLVSAIGPHTVVVELPDLDSCGGPLDDWKHHKPGEHLTHWNEKSLTGLGNLVLPDMSLARLSRPVPGKLQAVWRRNGM